MPADNIVQNSCSRSAQQEAIWLGGLLKAGDDSFNAEYKEYIAKHQGSADFPDFWRELQHIAKDDMETTPDGKVKIIEWKIAESDAFAAFEGNKIDTNVVSSKLSVFDHKYHARIIQAFNDDAEVDNQNYRLYEAPGTDTLIVVAKNSLTKLDSKKQSEIAQTEVRKPAQ